ncbi:MAG: PAS domain S-box protein, partial [Patescibacteria group bacterium]|nr:PAS domain S-box protein [Patescibacteria group bacterium]
MEEELAKLAQMVELSEDVIISLDMKGHITSWNSGAKRIYGYSGTEIIGKPLTLLIPENR